MAILSSTLVLRTNSLLHLYAAYLLLNDPESLPSQNLVLLLGNSMRLPDPSGSSFHNAGAATALAAFILTIMSLSDLLTTVLPTFAYDELWSAIAPFRGAIYLAVSTWIYLAGKQAPGSFGGTTSQMSRGGPNELKNSLVFTWAFVQMTIMFWVHIVLKDERKATAEKVIQERRARSKDSP